MESSIKPNVENQAIDGTYLDQEFARYAQVAQGLMRDMTSSEDRRIAARYITQCSRMKSDSILIKHHRNRFFRYLLKVMERNIQNQTANKNVFVDLPEEMMKPNEKNEMKQWSADGRTYVASKIIPGYATLIYMAVTKNTEDNWDHDGFAKFSSYLPNVDTEEILRNTE
ncbi:hypothetical protein PVAND_004856 [Polypedilum vanderplanki]|uniref:Uncharacterized protein n=1 Tax=Polypedilum vanderplanki TaxID=319348 RepID=A0A9J6BYH7_POLVA|nr:hypothetical protein PVAND_004856 [Polypedilum vanderplanki]